MCEHCDTISGLNNDMDTIEKQFEIVKNENKLKTEVIITQEKLILAKDRTILSLREQLMIVNGGSEIQ
jgi:hypothetical protein